MNISKCLKNYELEKSEEITTDVRGQHALTNGYRFEDDFENSRVLIRWHNDELEDNDKINLLKEVFEILDRHGFSEYMKLDEENLWIELTNFRD